jgi:N-ethylmaleimide reductase
MGVGSCCDRPHVNEFETKKHENNLFNPFKLGDQTIKNRFVMAAMTRCRADPATCVANDLHVQYYSDRAASAGLVLTECSGVSFRGNGFKGACGIWNDQQVEGWKRVTDAVHKVNGKIFLQIFHVGRAGRMSDIGNVSPLGPSPIPLRTKQIEGTTNFEYGDTPEALSLQGIKEIVEEFRKGAENAKKAGFDGLELHGANGYLVDQFLKSCSNQRTDEYGGSIQNRCRFLLEVMDALISVFGKDRVGIKLSPSNRYNDMYDSDPINLYKYLLQELSKKGIAFVEMVQSADSPYFPNFYGVKETDQIADTIKEFKSSYSGTYMANNNYSFETATTLVSSNGADLVSFGRFFLANPDLVERFLQNKPLNPLDFTTMYYGGEKGYNDYPKLQG